MTTNTPYDPKAEITLLRSQGYKVVGPDMSTHAFVIDGRFILRPKMLTIEDLDKGKTFKWKRGTLKNRLDILTGKIKAEAPLHNLVYVVGKTTTIEASRVSYAIAKQKQKDLKQTGNYNLGKLKIVRT